MEGLSRSQEGQNLHGEMNHAYSSSYALGEPLVQSRRSFGDTNGAGALLSGSTFNGQQQRQQAQLCKQILESLGCGFLLQQHQQQRPSASLSSLAHRAALSAEKGDVRGAAEAVVCFLKELGAALRAEDAVQPHQTHPRAVAESARAVVAVIAEYCRANSTANAAELLVQRELVRCVSFLFRLSPKLGAPGSVETRGALTIASAVAVTLHRVLGVEPRPKTDRGLQRHLQQQQQQQHILAAGLAAAQPKQVALMRTLLLSMHALLAELVRARNAAAAAGCGALPPMAEESTASAMAPPGTVGEISIELLLLLLPLSLAQPSPANQLSLQLRSITAPSGWGPPCELTTDFASTQESEPNNRLKRPSPQNATSASASLSWRRTSQEGALRGAPRAPTPQTPRSATGAKTPNPKLGASPVRAECLRCVEGLLKLSGRELFPYWSLLLHYKAPRLHRSSQPQWGFLLSTALAGALQEGPKEVLSAIVEARGPRGGLQDEQQQEALDQWLWELLGTQGKEQQELAWAFLATADESTKVRKAALGCLCALLEAPPLRQWPATTTKCGRCGPKALVMSADAWQRLVGPLGFRDSSAGSGDTGEGPHSLCCSMLPARQQQPSGPGAYTSLSRTVTQVSRCAIFTLFAVIRSQLVGQRSLPFACDNTPSKTTAAAAPSSLPRATTFPDAAASSGIMADAALQLRSPRCQSSQQGSQPPPEHDSTRSPAAVAFRGLAEALPALPLGILQPGIAAAAIRLTHPVVLLLVKTLQEQRQQLLQQPQQPERSVCCLCLSLEAPESSGQQWSALNAPAATVARRAQAGALPPEIAATAGNASWNPVKLSTAQPSKRLVFDSTPGGGTAVASIHASRGDSGALESFEAFAVHVLARGLRALHLMCPCLSMLTAVISGRQRQPQVPEALLLPISKSATVAGPCCLAALICQAVQTFTSLWCHPTRVCADYTRLQPAMSCLETPIRGSVRYPNRASCGLPAVATATRNGSRNGDGKGETAYCSNCGRHGFALIDGLLSVLHAIAKRYPQVLLLLQNGSPAAETGTHGCESEGGAEVPQAQRVSDQMSSPFIKMLRSIFQSRIPNICNRAAALAVEVLEVMGAAKTGERREEPRLNRETLEEGTSVRRQGASFEAASSEAILQATRASLVDLLHSLLVVPLLSGRSPSTSIPELRKCEDQQHAAGHLCTLAPPESMSPEQLSSTCAFLCCLTHEEWQRHGLVDWSVLKALRGLTLPHHHRSVRLAVAAALGAFASHAVQVEPLMRPAAGALEGSTNVAAAEEVSTATTDFVPFLDGQGVREALFCLRLQLADPLPDVRAASLCALCEAAGKLQEQQQHKSSPRHLKQSTCNMWGEVLKAINDMLQAGDKSAVAAVGLRAVGAVVPLVLLCASQRRHPLHQVEEPLLLSAAADDVKSEAEATQATHENRIGTFSHQWSPREEILRSLTLLGSALRPKGEGGEGGTEAAALQSTTHATADSNCGSTLVAEVDEDLSRSEAAAGLREMKLHWNACHSIRLIFSSPSASLFLAQDSCRVLSELWLAACDCLRTSQLAKVRCHAAAALASMVELLKSGLPMRDTLPGEVPKLCCANCAAPLLTEAWCAVAAAAKTVVPSAFQAYANERPGPGPVMRRYRESLRGNLERLLVCGLLFYTQQILKAEQDNQASLSPKHSPEVAAFDSHIASSTSATGARKSSCALRCGGCIAKGHTSPGHAAFEALQQAMECALQTGFFVVATS